MKVITCPLNGPRNAQEFICGGEVRFEPRGSQSGAQAWADYVFLQENPCGLVREWWCHVPSGYWFIVERDTASDTFLRSYPADHLFRQRPEETP
jgi:sarcosine oxidase subunit delta